MEKDTAKTIKDPANNGNNTGKDPATGKFLPGNTLGGKTPGAVSFKTKWIRFIEKIAEQNGITTDEVDEQLLKVAYKQMQSGDFRYWKDIQDRVWGSATHNTDITSGGEKLNISFDPSFNKDASTQ